jgi:hypothetical protein
LDLEVLILIPLQEAMTYNFDVLELICSIWSDILVRSHMRHVTPIVCVVRDVAWGLTGIEDESMNSSAINDRTQVGDP